MNTKIRDHIKMLYKIYGITQDRLVAGVKKSKTLPLFVLSIQSQMLNKYPNKIGDATYKRYLDTSSILEAGKMICKYNVSK